MTNCFCVPHKEYEEKVEADLQYAQDMIELNKKVAPQETLASAMEHHEQQLKEQRGRQQEDTGSEQMQEVPECQVIDEK